MCKDCKKQTVFADLSDEIWFETSFDEDTKDRIKKLFNLTEEEKEIIFDEMFDGSEHFHDGFESGEKEGRVLGYNQALKELKERLPDMIMGFKIYEFIE